MPVLGICYGHQLMARALGGEVAATGQREYGGTSLSLGERGGGSLLQDLPADDTVWMSHGDAVTRAPEGFRVTATTDQIPIAAMEDPSRGLYAVQFHPEVSHTPRRPGRDEAVPLRRVRPASRLDADEHHRGPGRRASGRRSAARRCSAR